MFFPKYSKYFWSLKFFIILLFSSAVQAVDFKLPFEEGSGYYISRCGTGQGDSNGHSYSSELYAIDFSTPEGTNIVAVADGEITHATDNFTVGAYDWDLRNSGNRIVIKHDDGTSTMYLHLLANSLVKTSGTVVQGEVLGKSGNTGYTTGPHLHLQRQITNSSWYGLSVDIPFAEMPSCVAGSTPISTNSTNSTVSGITRAEALKVILDEFDISTQNAGFNSSIFGDSINKPTDVTSSTDNYDYIVSAYNRGIVSGSNTTFRPSDGVTLAEYLVMMVAAIPVPLENSGYSSYSYNKSDWFYDYVNAAYNAGLISNSSYAFGEGVTSDEANSIASKGDDYYRGADSGISIYAHWVTNNVDIDLYVYDEYAGNGTAIEYDDNRIVSNMDNLRASGGMVYWQDPRSAWGGNLDYDSWGGNGSQPWAGFGEERSTVDSLLVRRPGIYDIIICYFDWNNSASPSSANVYFWGIQGGESINSGGEAFVSIIDEGECHYAGYLQTN